MRRINLIILGILLLGVVVSAGIGILDKEVVLSREAKQFYQNKGIEITYRDYEEGEQFWRCLTSNRKFNLPCSQRFSTYYKNCIKTNIHGICKEYEKVYYTDAEKDTILDKWQKKKLIEIYELYKKRKAKAREIIKEGNINIKEAD